MMQLLLIMFIGFLIGVMMSILFNFLSLKEITSGGKSSPFECGFNPMIMYRSFFSLQFFLIGLLFLVLDVELVIMFPFMVVAVFFGDYMYSYLLICFVIILLIGIMFEWINGVLEWVY